MAQSTRHLVQIIGLLFTYSVLVHASFDLLDQLPDEFVMVDDGAPITFQPVATSDCGKQDAIVSFGPTRIRPDPIIYPGNVNMDIDMSTKQDLPSENLKMRLRLEKLEPVNMFVPCLRGIGSCTYDVCEDILPNHRDIFSLINAYSCPLTKGRYQGNNVEVPLPNIGGPVVARILQGNYRGNITFYHGGTGQEYGCLAMKFSLKAKDEA